MLSLTLPPEAQAAQCQICWQLLPQTPSSDTILQQSWTLEDITLLPALPTPMEWILQFRLQTNCPFSGEVIEESDATYNILVQYSNDEGRRWNSFHQLCLPPFCIGKHSAIQTSWSESEVVPWERYI